MTKNKLFASPFRALRSSQFRVYSIGIFISLMGTFLQLQVLRTLGYEVTQTASFVGLIAACTAIPGMVFFIPGNIVASLYERRQILIVSAILTSLAPGWLSYLAATGQLTPTSLVVASLWLGCIIPFENPARYPLIANTVEPTNIGNAFAFSQWLVYLSKAAGPILGAAALAAWGAAPCFAINAASYGAEIVSLCFLKDCVPRTKLNVLAFFDLRRFTKVSTVCISAVPKACS
ncbi:hypothetical protein BH10CYA1_BH10CYA1_53850 [soil metagenome]